jgi:hypothetical protein
MSTEKFILILDSSQLSAFSECPQLWDYSYQQRLMPSARSSNVPMDMGSYGHRLLEIIYKERARGTKDNDAIEAAFNYDIDKETCRCGHTQEKHLKGYLNDSSIDIYHNCQSIGCSCVEFVGITFPLSDQERGQVKQRVLEYTMYEGSAFPELRAASPDHVEVGFSHLLYEDNRRLYILEGRVDLIGQIANNYPDGWADHKFQMRARDLYLKSIQFRNYSMVLERPIGVVNYIRFTQKLDLSPKTSNPTFKRALISFSRAELDWWKGEVTSMFSRVENYIRNERQLIEQSGRRNWGACSGQFGYPCDFTPLCENVPFGAGLVQIKQDQDFVVKPEWRAW